MASMPTAKRVAHGDGQTDLAGDVSLPVLESAGVVAQRVRIGVNPGRGFQIDEGRFEGGNRIPPHVEEAGPAWPSEVLAPGGREHVAADLPHVDGQLANRQVFWLKWTDAFGRTRYRSSGSQDRDAAENMLRDELKHKADDLSASPDPRRTLVGDLLGALKNRYRVEGRRSLERLEDAVDHLLRMFRGVPAAQVKGADVLQTMIAFIASFAVSAMKPATNGTTREAEVGMRSGVVNWPSARGSWPSRCRRRSSKEVRGSGLRCSQVGYKTDTITLSIIEHCAVTP